MQVLRRWIAPLFAVMFTFFVASAASAQTQVLIVGDGSIRSSGAVYIAAAITEFTSAGAVVTSRNDLNTVTLTPADLLRPTGARYDIIVVVSIFEGIGTANWTLLRDAVRTRAARAVVLFSDHCSSCSADNVDGGNGNGSVPLINAATGWTTSRGINIAAPGNVALNTNSPFSGSFTGMSPMAVNDWRYINQVPANNVLYASTSGVLPAVGTALTDNATAVIIPGSQSYGGSGACVFVVSDVNPLAIPGNPGLVGPALVTAAMAPSGSCSVGLSITGPTTGSVISTPRPTITGTGDPGGIVTVVVGGLMLGPVTVAADGTWSLTVASDLPDGPYTAIATQMGTPPTARTTFTISRCSGGLVGSGEQCDDRNARAGDGCSATCTIENGFVCRGEPSVCAVTCGDGVHAASEACDDGNVLPGDGCSATCTIENGFTCSNPDTRVFYSHRGLADCIEMPGFEPAASATLPARLAVSGVGVWPAYRARYVQGAVDYADRPTSWRAPTALQWDPGTGVRAAVFGGFTNPGQTSAALARTVAERALFDFTVGVAGSVRAGAPDIVGACGNNSNDTVAYRIDSLSVCRPACMDDSPAGTDTGCSSTAPHCLGIGGGGAQCEPCINSTVGGSDLGCPGATPVCIAGSTSNRCVACEGAADCNDGNACTLDTCALNACVFTGVPAGDIGMCGSGVCSGAPTNACVECLQDSECMGLTQFCDTMATMCVPRIPNGMSVPTVPGHTPTLIGMCTEAAAMSACASNVCETSDSLCGYLNGPTGGPCTDLNAAIVCRSSVCSPSDMHCGYDAGEGPCTSVDAVTVCRSGVCGADGLCRPTTGCNVDADCDTTTQFCNNEARLCTPKLPNSTAIPTVTGHTPVLDAMCSMTVATIVCQSGVCEESDDRCGLLNDTACTALTECRSSVCFTDMRCGLPVGEACTGPAVCRSNICGANMECGECNAATPCTGGRICNADTSLCETPVDGGMRDAGAGDAGASDAGFARIDGGPGIDAGPTRGGLAGGAMCAAQPGRSATSTLFWSALGLVSVTAARRRRC